MKYGKRKKKRKKYKEDKNYKKLITVSRYERKLLLFEILLRERTNTKLVSNDITSVESEAETLIILVIVLIIEIFTI